jgi:hypothetical protein
VAAPTAAAAVVTRWHGSNRSHYSDGQWHPNGSGGSDTLLQLYQVANGILVLLLVMVSTFNSQMWLVVFCRRLQQRLWLQKRQLLAIKVATKPASR